MPVDYRFASGEDVVEAARQGYIAVIPTGSLEQHCDGPLGIDGLVAERIAWESCRLLEERDGFGCLVLPTIYYGFSPEWTGTPGTITLTVQTYKGMISDILSSLAQQGFDRIAIVNGHGGNSLLLEAIVREWLSGSDATIMLVDYWKVTGLMMGHASRGEQKVAQSLGIEAQFTRCGQKGVVSKGYKVLVRPPKTTIGVDDESDVDMLDPRVVVEHVYRALLELARRETRGFSL